MLENGIVMLAIILSVNIVYVSLLTVRMIFTLKGKRYIAASVGVFEITAYTLGLGLVLDNLDQIQNLIAYALGFGLGVITGMKIEEKLAIGYITVNIISSNPDIPFTETLREKGYGVTSWYAYGMEGDRLAMQVLTPRKYELMLYETIKEIDPKAFIIAYEPRQIFGGFWVKKVKGSKLRREEEKLQSE
ncbi:DUF2179 domain-containing protein [Piscibacillus halophilus]|uniref:UPF0316 protein SAMN05216362_11432 n=1 Tax=Piscibacillus halophilus TaxID=571933 RepID=A0A1H9G5C8_9BACI|nr:DUF2179 domain-containing protein [Piscibacillus halophilus]SEQ45327.1 Uncharacterized protein YebE, UPF0316 family [Piscibacillus halophilus]